MYKLLCIGVLATGVAGCRQPEPNSIQVALDVNNGSTDAGRPDSARMQVYCDGVLKIDTTLGNVHSGPPYQTGDTFNRHWLTVKPGRHHLRVEVLEHGLALDTVLTLDTLSFTSVNLHHHIRRADTLRLANGSVGHIIPADTTSKITISKVAFARPERP